MAGPWEIEPKVRRLDGAPVWPCEAARYQRPHHRRPITEMHHRDASQRRTTDALQRCASDVSATPYHVGSHQT